MTAPTDESTTSTVASVAGRLSTGVAGIDEILQGGLVPGRSTLIRGPPGAGKTLFGLHYLAAGAEQGETCLFVNLGEPEQYIIEDAESFGFVTEDIHFLDLRPSESVFADEASFDVFPTAEVEGPPLTEAITETIDELGPDRIFVDPMNTLRFLIDDPYQFRQHVMSFRRYVEDTNVVYTSQADRTESDSDLQFLSDAVITLDNRGDYRSLSVSKFRGSSFQSGDHSLRITDDGMVVSPRIVPEAPDHPADMGTLSSGVPELDRLLHGGIDRETVTLLTGPTGVGKTTTGLQFIKESTDRGVNSVLYSFEEGRHTLLKRARAIDIPVVELLDEGPFILESYEPDQVTVHEFAQQVREHVETGRAELVMLDGLDGYLQCVDGASLDSLFRLGRYLRGAGATTILVNETRKVTGEFQATETGISPLADAIVFLRHIELVGQLRKVIGVLKQRTSDYERTLRELRITEHGIKVDEPLPELRGILTGTPDWHEPAHEVGLDDGLEG